MNKKKLCLKFILFLTLIISNTEPLLAQKTKQKIKTNTKSEIDILYDKYKNTDSILISDANGVAHLGVEIKTNSNGKAISIILSGIVWEKSVAEAIIDNLTNDKKRKGFEYSNFAFVTYGSENDDLFASVSVSVYTKGNQYAKYGIDEKRYEFKSEPYYTESEEDKKIRLEHNLRSWPGKVFIYLEVGDASRNLGSKSEKFTF